ncbi:MAG: ABC transporter ATP-binding protein/permease [Oscillospiraceae bacterium]|nr:ABC transporter ATP-binding protein/permease [Oscillospiraceae bacterium]
MKGKTKKLSFFATYSYVFMDLIRAKPVISIVRATMDTLGAAFSVLSIVLAAMLFENIEASLTPGAGTSVALLLLLAIFGIMVINVVNQGIGDYLHDQRNLHYQRYSNVKMLRKSASIDPLLYEDPKLFDEMVKAQEGLNYSAWLGTNIFSILFYNIPYFILFGIFLFSLEPIFVLSLSFTLVPAFLSQFIRMRINTKLQDELAPVNREYWSYEEMTCSREFFKETRILGIFPNFKNMYMFLIKLLNQKQWKAESKNLWIELGTGALSLAGFISCIIMLFFALFNGQVSIGAFAAVFGALGGLFSMMEDFARWQLGTMIHYFGVVRNYVTFMKLPEREPAEISEKGDIVFEDTSFIYPNSEHLALQNVNLTIKEGETLAIVGENGAGKSTLIKLLLGIYTPTKGRVTRGGHDVSAIGTSPVSAVFQNYQRYMMTLSENIDISDSVLNDNVRQIESVHAADLPLDDVNVFPEGMMTMLSREFEGVDLSGGQWQRVALARGLYRRHNMIVLDEPTAAIDPLEETRIYKKFGALAKGKTAVVVTHRLGSARIADRIIVMKDGEIAEEGKHENLLLQNGVYAKMFYAQSEWYERVE